LRVANKEATNLDSFVRTLLNEKQFSTFQTSIMAALIKKAPVLVNTALELAKPQLNTFLRYAKVELTPPSPGEIPAAIADISTKVANLQKQTFREWTVRQTAINAVVGVEVACWFFIGECIGKGSLVGYDV